MWTDRLPPATVFTGPVVDIPDAIERALSATDAARPDGSRP
jgi:hypothetical protein